ncbi:flagellar biosynthetic protein FliR [Terrilactibacillus sp. S3-3]|nr:flagellar biosynthetic protein FliR [Terrilactibacillus sp. S3-3]
MPIFSYRTIPGRVKIGIAGALSILVEITLFKNQPVPLNDVYVLLVIKEALVGQHGFCCRTYRLCSSACGGLHRSANGICDCEYD